MTHSEKPLIDAYKEGLGYKPYDVLVPREGAHPCVSQGVYEKKVVVLAQNPGTPWLYDVVGEAAAYPHPSDRFVKFTINGHDWCRK
jgi:hypothetical protein